MSSDAAESKSYRGSTCIDTLHRDILDTASMTYFIAVLKERLPRESRLVIQDFANLNRQLLKRERLLQKGCAFLDAMMHEFIGRVA